MNFSDRGDAFITFDDISGPLAGKAYPAPCSRFRTCNFGWRLSKERDYRRVTVKESKESVEIGRGKHRKDSSRVYIVPRELTSPIKGEGMVELEKREVEESERIS